MRLKSTNPKKEHLVLILILHIKFQLPSPIGGGRKGMGGGVMRVTNSKSKKNQPKNHIITVIRVSNKAKKSRPLKSTSKTPNKSIYQVSTS